MKSEQTIIRKNLMEQLNFITNLLEIKGPNITILDVLNAGTHKEIIAKLDYPAPKCPHFQEKQTEHFFGLIEDTISCINPIFQTVFKTFLKERDKIINALELPYSNAKLEATNNLIKVIKRNAFGFRNFDNFKKRILIALNIKKERTNSVLSRV